MMHEVQESLQSRDLVLFLLDVTHRLDANDRFALQMLERAGGPAFLVLTKIDLVEKSKLLPLIAEYSRLHAFSGSDPGVVAKKRRAGSVGREGCECAAERAALLSARPDDRQPERFIAAELIRERFCGRPAKSFRMRRPVVVDAFEEDKAHAVSHKIFSRSTPRR